MGLFERIKKAKRSDIREVETCVMDERMWNIFNRIPWRVYYGKEPVLAWVALNSWEEEYLQYAYLKTGIIEDGARKLIIRNDSFIYENFKCEHIVIPPPETPRYCNEFGCRALLLTPRQAMERLWYLYEVYAARKIKSV